MESYAGFTNWLEKNHPWVLEANALEVGKKNGFEWEIECDVENHIERLLEDFQKGGAL